MIKYEGKASYDDALIVSGRAGILFGALQFRFSYSDKTEGGLFLFGKQIKTLEQLTKKKLKEDNPSPENNEEDSELLLGERYGVFKYLWKKSRVLYQKTKEAYEFIIPLSSAELQELILEVIKKILRQVLPREMVGDFKFGFEDPYYTGKLLELFAIIYAASGDKLHVEPVWNEHYFKGHIELYGKIHITIVGFHLLRLLFNREFRKVWREYNGKRV